MRAPRASTVIAVVVGLYGLLLLFLGVGLLLVPDALEGGVDNGAQVAGILFAFLGVLTMLLGRGLLQRRRRAWGYALVLAAATLPSTALRVVQGESILFHLPTMP